MGPTIIFDKSTLESLNPDEAMWLDNFYISNITPLFFIETLADLEKKVRSGRTPEEVVGSLAYKTPDYSSKLNIVYSTLLQGELLGFGKIDMATGRAHVGGGKIIKLGSEMGTIFKPSPEEEAFSRWQKKQFIEVERLLAKQWRKNLSNIDLNLIYSKFQSFFSIKKPKTLIEVKGLVDTYINGSNQKNIFIFGLDLLGISKEAQKEILLRWNKEGSPNISNFCPYFFLCFFC
jgi:hypothetical protein